MTTTNRYVMYTPPKIVGYVLPFDGMKYSVTGKRPSRFHLWMMRVCFGWKWEDAK